MCRRAGFTFIEIMLVVVIIGFLAAVTMPRLKGTFKQARLKAAARDVTGLLRYSRNVAVMREKPCQLRFDPEKDLYQLVLLDDDGEKVKEKSRRRREKNEVSFTASDDVGGVRRLPQQVHFAVIYTAAPLTEDTDKPCVEYYADGSATPATIVLQDEDKHTMNVEIFRTTGMARVEKGMPLHEPKKQTQYYGPSMKAQAGDQ